MKSTIEVNLDDYLGFDVTGTDVYGRRFKRSYSSNKAGFFTAFGINLHNGSVWGVRKDGTRKLLKRVYN